MARYPFRRVPDQPPYIYRSKIDQAMLDVANYPVNILLVGGDRPGSGVSRSTKTFVDKIAQTGFRRRPDRHPVVVDLYGGTASLDAIEFFAILRNALVHETNRLGGASKIGSYLFPFDSLYTIWKGQTGRQTLSPPLLSTKRATRRKKVAKIAINFGTLGILEWVGSAAEAADILKELSWSVEGPIDQIRGAATDSLFERTVTNVEQFIHRNIAPRLDSRLRKGIGSREVMSSDILAMMMDLFLEALINIQNDLEEKSNVMFFVDAIDEAEDETIETSGIRYVVSTVAYKGLGLDCACVMGGRAPLDRWEKAIGSKLLKEQLGPIAVTDIERALTVRGFSEDTIGKLIDAAGAPSAIFARSLSEAYKKLGLNNPKK